jgi:hypothetical protein
MTDPHDPDGSRAVDMAGLARRLVSLARSGPIPTEVLDDARKRIALVEGDHFAVLALRPSECRRFVVERFDEVRELAHWLGYAVAVHGSGARDIDIVAIPWVGDSVSPSEFVQALTDMIGRCDLCEGKQAVVKAHGRRSWSIWLHEYSTYLDLSVTPRTEDRP